MEGDEIQRADKIQLEIVTPKGRALRVVVDEVTAPSVKGEFGVLPGHLPLLAALHTGLVSFRVGTETTRCAIGPGFAEVGPNKVLVLTNDYVERQGLDPVLVRKEFAEVEAQLEKLDPTVAGAESEEIQERRLVLIERQNFLAAQLELYGETPPATMRPAEAYAQPSPEDQDFSESDSTEG